jgi:hypothetical protein
MGGQLMMIAMVQYAHLPGTQYKALMKICATALDTPNTDGHPARWYYRGWEDLALGVGWNVPADTPANKKRRKTMRGEMNKIYRALAAAGAIDELPHPGDGRRKAWYVALNPRLTGGSPVESKPSPTPDRRVIHPPDRRVIHPPDRRVIHPAPSIRSQEEQQKDEQPGAGAQPQTAREADAAGDEQEVLNWLAKWSDRDSDRVRDECVELVRKCLGLLRWEVPDLLARLEQLAEGRKSRDPVALVKRVSPRHLRVVG